MSFTKDVFGPDFQWGVSTAAYQTEGAYNIDGKGASIWDIFANTKGKTFANQNANTTCDFYHHYAQDIALMAMLNIPNFRFSISWSRILPNGTGAVNHHGVDFYNRVIDFCLEVGVQPWITLYHWDLPDALQQKGGWTNRDIIHWFSGYVTLCAKLFGDRVKNWMVLNEPMVFTGAGYFLGVHAPGKRGLNNFLAATHHAAMCQAEGGRILRSARSDLKIGTTFSSSHIEPVSTGGADQLAATRVDAVVNRLFVEPLAGLGYPIDDFKLLQRIGEFVKSGDEQKLAFDMDFIGVQNYTREIVAASYYTPAIWARVVPADKRRVPITLMNWEVYPECIYHTLHRFNTYNFKELIVTENGAAYTDEVVDGSVADDMRQEYLQNHIAQVARAKREGVNVKGYFVWSFTDNFEWAEGYRPRFGLVHVDFKTQKRIVKNSGKWYGNLIKQLVNSGAAAVLIV